MLEALISLRRTRGEGEIGGAEKALKKTGDIIVVKKSPAVWGSDEKKFFLIVKIKDDELETKITDGVMIHPYAEYVDDEMTSRSVKQVDITKIPTDSPGLDPKIEQGAIDVGAKKYLELSDLKSAAVL